MRPRPGHGRGIVMGLLGLVWFGWALEAWDDDAQRGPPPALVHPPASESTQFLTGEWLQRRVGLQKLALPSGFTDHHFIPGTVEELNLRGSKAESIDELPPNLHRLDLRDSSTKRLGPLPPELEWLDLRGTELTVFPITALPRHLGHLGVDGKVVSRWLREGHGELPSELRSLVVYRPPADLLELRLPESLEALGLTQGEVKSLEGPPGLPQGLRRLCLEETDLKDLKGVPETLDELHLLGNTSLDGLPPYVTRLVLGTGAVIRLPRNDGALRFLQVLEVSGGKVLGGFESLPLLASLDTDELKTNKMEAAASDPMPWLERLKLVAEPDEEGMPQEQITWLADRSHDLELDLEIGSLEALRGRQADLKGLRSLNLKLPYEGEKLPPGLAELNVQLRAVALSGLPSLERLTLRHRGSAKLEVLLPASLPDSLVELRIDSNVVGAALPAGWVPPPRLQELAFDGVDLRPWINSLQAAPEKVFPNLEEVVLRDVELDHLDWLPPTVTRLLLLDGHPEKEDGILDGCF